MKKILTAIGTLIAMAGLHSCMDFDLPVDTLTGGQTELEGIVYKGKADSINYKKDISIEGARAANRELQKYFAQMQTAQYCIRGGKEGQLPGAHQYQYVYNITVDNYAGYLVTPHNFAHGGGGLMSSTYYYNNNYCDGPYGAYLMVKNCLTNMLNHPQIDSIPEIKALGLLLFDYSSQEMVDLYGAIPYVDHKDNKESNPFNFNKMADVYVSIVNNLDTINACLKHYPNRPAEYKALVEGILQQYDWITRDMQIESWRLLNNSLKLRMAMHIVKVAPDLAKKWAEEAVAEGVIENLSQEVGLLPLEVGCTHPLVDICTLWGDTRLNASFESILVSLKHPYLDYLFEKNNADIVNKDSKDEVLAQGTRVVGLRAGIAMTKGQTLAENPRQAYSRIASDVIAQAPLYFMKLSEVQFLRAEGAIRGWAMGGDAKTFYENGIRNGQVESRTAGQYGYAQKIEEYLTLKAPVKYTYTDPMDHSYDAASVTEIGVAWDESDSPEVKLEKIITQKYIAGFPYSYEAWTDYRRTGYPKQFPVLNPSDGDGSLADGDIIRRIPLPGRDTSVGLSDITTTGLDALGGADAQGTRVWWDVEGVANF